MIKTHCGHGNSGPHPWIPENIGQKSSGRRYCKACGDKRVRAWLTARQQARTTCDQGHPLVPSRNGSRYCRTCRSASARAHSTPRTTCDIHGPGGIVVRKNGHRDCRPCRAARAVADRRSRIERGYLTPMVDGGTCKNGHELHPDTVGVKKDGIRYCRPCQRGYRRKHDERARERRGVGVATPGGVVPRGHE